MTELQTLRIMRAVQKVLNNDRRRQTMIRGSRTTKRIADEYLQRDLQELRKLIRETNDE